MPASNLQPHIRMAWLIKRACATQIEAAQLALCKLHQGWVLLQVIAEHRNRFRCIGDFIASAERITPV